MVIFIFIYLLFIAVNWFLFVGLSIMRRTKKITLPKLTLEDITLMIPFRNEAENLPQLITDLRAQTVLPHAIIFVDDHSTDSSVAIVEDFSNAFPQVKLISLESDQQGKKVALREGMKWVSTDYVHTMDSDVRFKNDFYLNIASVQKRDLMSLPVVMKGSTFLSRFFGLEYNFFAAFNLQFATFYPVSATGANLIFSNKELSYAKQLKEHGHLSSGDDYFLLKYARKQGKSIQIIGAEGLAVTTSAPESLHAYIQQRVRWLSKTKFQLQWGEILMGGFLSFYLLGGFITLIFASVNGFWLIFAAIYSSRFFLDTFIFGQYKANMLVKSQFVELLLFQIVYPLLFIIVGVSSFFIRPTWKGRQIQ